MDEASKSAMMLVRMYIILSRAKVLRPGITEFIKMCSDAGVEPSRLIGYIDIGPGGVVLVNSNGEEFLRRIKELIELGGGRV